MTALRVFDTLCKLVESSSPSMQGHLSDHPAAIFDTFWEKRDRSVSQMEKWVAFYFSPRLASGTPWGTPTFMSRPEAAVFITCVQAYLSSRLFLLIARYCSRVATSKKTPAFEINGTTSSYVLHDLWNKIVTWFNSYKSCL